MNKNIDWYSYSAFNLNIRSSVILPELTPQEGLQDIVIRKDYDMGLAFNEDPASEYHYSINSDRAHIHFPAVGTFFINNGNEIVISPIPDVEEKLWRLGLLGAALAVLLYQRGKLVLHSSAVDINGNAVAFVGNKGDGKSTMSAALCKAGHKLLVDDTVAINLTKSDKPIILSGFPQVKLYPDSVIAALNENPEGLADVASNYEKRAKLVESFCEVNRPLKAIYVLKQGKSIKITKLSLQESLQHIITHSYMARFSTDWMKSGTAISNFRQASELIKQVPIFFLERPRDLSVLKDVVSAVEQHSYSF